MTDPIEDAMKAAAEANHLRIEEIIQPPVDAFQTPPAMTDMVDSLSSKAFFDQSALTQAVLQDNHFGEYARAQLEPLTSALADFASVQVARFRSALVDAMPDITAMWNDRVDTTALTQGIISSTAIELPKIDFGLKDALSFNAYVPQFDDQTVQSIRDIVAAQAPLVDYQADLTAITRAISAHSGVGTIAAEVFADTHGAKLAEAMRALAPQMPEFPDFSFMREFAGSLIDNDLADAVEEKLSGDATTADHLSVAIYETEFRFGVSYETARKMVIGTIYFASFTLFFYVLQFGPSEVSRTLSNILTAGGIGLPALAHKGINKVMPERWIAQA